MNIYTTKSHPVNIYIYVGCVQEATSEKIHYMLHRIKEYWTIIIELIKEISRLTKYGQMIASYVHVLTQRK